MTMEREMTVNPKSKTSDVKVWHCRGCGVVHLAIGERVVNFRRDEFEAFTQAVVDTNYASAAAVNGLTPLLDHVVTHERFVH